MVRILVGGISSAQYLETLLKSEAFRTPFAVQIQFFSQHSLLNVLFHIHVLTLSCVAFF